MKSKLFLCLALTATVSTSSGVTIGLFESLVNIDGDTSPGSGVVDNLDASGLGSLTLSVSGLGPHYLGLFVDHEIDETTNTFFNEYGAAHGAAAAGQSWEIDEPEFVFGDIFSNLVNAALDGNNAVPAGSEDDVSMALGWDLTLDAGETGIATFLLSETAPRSGFYLSHIDPDSDAAIYFSSQLRIKDGSGEEPGKVPDGGATFALLLAGMTGLVLFRNPKKTSRQ